MKIEKLPMCRICLAEDVRMFVVTNKDIQALYEKLTDIPFITEDSRPMLACVYCCAKLKQCCRLQRKCVEAEKLLTQMINEDDEIKLPTQGLLELIISPAEQISFYGGPELEMVDIKDELPDNCDNDIKEMKDEQQTEAVYLVNYPNLEDIAPKHSASDGENDIPLKEFKIEVDEESVASETQSAFTAKKPRTPGKTKLEDTMKTQQRKTGESASANIRNTKKCIAALKSKKSKSINNIAKATNGFKRDYICDVCQRVFGYASHFIIHFRSHTGEKPFKCDMCPRRYNNRHSLKNHMRMHPGQQPFKCDICQRGFTTVSHLKEHKHIHTGEKPYKCEICQQGFSAATTLKKHRYIHLPERPFKCDTCLRTFSYRSSLKRHNRLHTGDRPFHCDVRGQFHSWTYKYRFILTVP